MVAGRFGWSVSTAYRRLESAIQALSEAMNNLGGSSVPTKTNGHQHDPDKQLPTELAPGEQEAMTLYDCLDRKLERLPAGWSEIRIKRGIRDSYQIAVVYT